MLSKSFILVLLILLVLMGCSDITKSSTSKQLSSEVNNTTTQAAQTLQETKINVNHQIVYTLKNKRFDKGVNLYVLIDPVDLKKSSYEEDIKLIINKLVKEYGSKTSIEFHDDKQSLDISYKLYGDLSLKRNTNKSENELLAIHHISSFSGDLSTDLYKNTLYFFPQTNSDHKTVGNLVKILEYNPS